MRAAVDEVGVIRLRVDISAGRVYVSGEVPHDLFEDILDRDYTLGDLVDRHCHELGLMVRPLINICILSPPLVISFQQVDELVEKLEAGIQAAYRELREPKK